MGQDISHSTFIEKDFDQFKNQLIKETEILKNWLEKDDIIENNSRCGLELEAWITDKNFTPSPTNDKFLKNLHNRLVVPELSKFNFEINSHPFTLQNQSLSQLNNELEHIWNKCQQQAKELNSNVITIGILPTIKDEMLNINNMTSTDRFKAMNRELLKMRQNKPLKINIKGKDSVSLTHKDVMLEAAATSLQIHIQVNPKNAVRFYNAAHIASSLTVALSANSPFLFGKQLWDETRIPLCEQSISVKCFKKKGEVIKRVTFGSGYIKNSILEPFVENLEKYPVMLPVTDDTNTNHLCNLRLHNGTIWRWNRPLIGIENNKPNIRIEHRVTSAGTSIVDMIANIAFFIGIINYLGKKETPPEQKMPFEIAKENFYNAAKNSFNANISWLDGKEHNIKSLILNELLPLAKQALIDLKFSKTDVNFYLDDIIKNRLETGMNGAKWQKDFIKTHGPDFVKLTEIYMKNQKMNIPVHQWKI